jgi:DNA-directed RNA polymerase subunit H (RpoH/RPB5)
MNEFNVIKQCLIDRKLKFKSINDDGEVWVDESNNEFLLLKNIVDSVQIKFIGIINKILQKHNIKNGIQLYRDNTSTNVKQKLIELNSTIQLISLDELCCNIMQHKYQPQMQKCTHEQANKVIAFHKYHLPRFQQNDAVVRWMNWKKSDVIAICIEKCGNKLRDDGKCCKNCNYRIVF